MSFILTEDLSQIVSLFPSLFEISKKEWRQEGIKIIHIASNYKFEEEELREHAVLIMNGTFEIRKSNDRGEEITFYRVHVGECFPLMTSSLFGEKYEFSCCALTCGEVLLIPVGILRHWINRYRNCRQFIFKASAGRIALTTNRLQAISSDITRKRLAELLLQMNKQTGNLDTLNITIESLFFKLDSARGIIRKTLSELEDEETIRISNGQITIKNRTALEHIK